MKFRIMIEPDETRESAAECSSLPGSNTQGKTRTEVLKNIKDAIRGYLVSLKKHNEPIPPSIYKDVIDVDA